MKRLIVQGIITALIAPLLVTASYCAQKTTEAQKPDAQNLRPPASAKPGQTWTNPKDGSVMIFVPAGKFVMGGQTEKEPKHTRELGSYWIDKYEVTNAQFMKFVKATNYAVEGGWDAEDPKLIDKHPVINVSWKDACAYAKWANKRLPTEAEWERAARGTDGRKYPWGNEWHSGWAALEKGFLFDTAPVGSHPEDKSPVGCMDMLGNAQEWCLERFSGSAYTRYMDGDQSVPPLGTAYCLRGGYPTCGSTVTCSHRFWGAPMAASGGIRCVIGPEPEFTYRDTDHACEYNSAPRIYRTSKPPKEAKAGDVWICPKNGAEMVYIPAGEFKTGRGRNLKGAETGAYWFSRYPITVGQYREFVEKTSYKPLEYWEIYDLPGKESHPACGISYEDAEAYAKWVGQRLASPNEWEKAARGTDGRACPWGNKYYKEHVVPLVGGGFATVPVGSKPVNKSPYGVFDMGSEYFGWVNDPEVADSNAKDCIQMGEPDLKFESDVKGGETNSSKAVCRRLMAGLYLESKPGSGGSATWATMITARQKPDGKTYMFPGAFLQNYVFRCVLDAE